MPDDELKQPLGIDECATTLPPTGTPLEKSRQIGPYKLLQKLGEGGMGTVWMAEQETPIRRRVALKVIKAGLDNKQVIARFEAERQALAMMNHENIAKILDVGTSANGQPYFVMELVQGIPFNKWCDTNKLSINERLELFIPVCKATQHAHQKGIIHRDLKPSNVLVCLYDGRAVPKIIDFGLAKALGPNTKLTDKTMFTEFGQVVGTLQYMSPEQAEMNQLDIDTRTDIYSLGVMLYELLTGSTPIDQHTLKSAAVFKILESIRDTDPPRPSARLSSFAHEAVSGISAQRRIDEHKLKSILRGELDWIVMKSIEKNRCRRYETANDFAEDILHYLNNEVVKAKPPSRRYRLEKYIRKHKGLVASLCVIAMLLTGAAAISGWFAFQANAAKVVAERKTDEALFERQAAIDERTKADAARKEASINEQLAKQRTLEALEQAKNAKKQLVRFYVANGVRFGESNSPWEALSWYAKAWESEPEKDFASESAFRARIGAAIANTPKLAAVFFHENMVFDAVLSPDGTRLLTLPESDEAWLYDVASQAPIARLKHDGTVLTAAFSPDSATVATGGNDKKLKLWNSEDGVSLGNDLLQSGEVRSIDFHPTLPLVATGAGEVGIWDIRTGQQVPLNEAPKSPWHVKFSNEGGELLVAYERFARVWSTADWLPVGLAMAHSGLAVNSMIDHLQNRTPSRDKPFPSLSPDGKKLAIFGSNGAQIVDLATGDKTQVTGNGSSINSASFSSDGKQLLVCGYNQKVNIYDTESRKLTNSFTTPRSVLQATWHPSLPVIIATSAGGVTHLINAVTGMPIAPQLKHAVSTSRVNFSPDGMLAMVADLDGTVRLWELHGSSYQEYIDPSVLSVINPSLSPNRMLRAKAIADDLGIVLVDVQSGRTVSKTPSVDEATEVVASDRNVVYSPDGNFILTFSKSDLHLWSAKDCQRISTLSGAIEESNPKRWLKFSKDGSRFLTVDSSRKIGIFETQSGNPVGPRIPADDSELRVVSISSEGTKWAMGGKNSQADVFDASTGRKLISVMHRGYISGISFSADDTLLATASLDNTCRVWDVQTGKPVSPPLRHEGYALDAKFNPNGVQIATCGKDNTVRLWDIRTGQPLMPPIRNSGSFIEFNAEGDSIFYVAPNGRYSRWKLPKFAGSPSSIAYLARLFTGRFMDDTDGFTEVEKSEFRDHLATYRSAWFDYLNRPVPSIPSAAAASRSLAEPIQIWHARSAEVAEARQDWFAATFHLGRLARLTPDDAAVEVRFQQVKAKYRTLIARVRERIGIAPDPSSATASADSDDKSQVAQQRLLVLNESLWARVRNDRSENSPPLAVSEIEEFRVAVAAHPLGTYFNTLATAEYRLGNYEASISAAIKSIELTPAERGLPGPHPIDLAILAMSHSKLGNAEKSQTYRLLFDNAMKAERWKTDSDCLSFADELYNMLIKANK
jgi:eukaryotic-like serine/threonine-protein kinase